MPDPRMAALDAMKGNGHFHREPTNWTQGDADDRPPPTPEQSQRSSGKGRKREPEGDPEPAPTVETFAAPDLVAMELPEPKYAVEGLVPEGMTILAGKPKLGKSWAALNLALAVADGGVALGSIPVDGGEVLYLALEDTPRRLRDRLRKLLSRTNAKAPAGLTLATAWPRQDKGGAWAVREWLDAHPEARLLVIDTWQKFRPSKIRNRDSYEEDYEHAGELKALADKYGVGLLILHHCRKMETSDPVDSVSGTLGLTGCADAVLVMTRERGQHDAALFVTGRDVEEKELALQWDRQYCLWSIMGEAQEYRLSRERTAVLDLLGRMGRALSPSEAAPLLRKTVNATKNLLWHICTRTGNSTPLVAVCTRLALTALTALTAVTTLTTVTATGTKASYPSDQALTADGRRK